MLADNRWSGWCCVAGSTSMAGDPTFCSACSNLVADDQDGLLCDGCLKWSHRTCVSMTKKAYIQVSKSSEQWFCDTCKVGKDANVKQKRNYTLEDVMDKLEVMENKYNALFLKYSDQVKVNEELQDEVTKIKYQLNKMEQDKLKNNIIVQGIPYYDDENVSDIVRRMGQKLEVPIKRNFKAYRLGRGVNSPIKIEMEDSEEKNKLFKSKKKQYLESKDLGFPTNKKIYLNPDLTEANLKLFTAARIFKKMNNYKYVWFSAGNIFLREGDNTKVMLVKNEEQLKNL